MSTFNVIRPNMQTLPPATVSSNYPGYHAFQTAHGYAKRALEEPASKDKLDALTSAVMNLNTAEERKSEEFGAQLNRIENYLARKTNKTGGLELLA